MSSVIYICNFLFYRTTMKHLHGMCSQGKTWFSEPFVVKLPPLLQTVLFLFGYSFQIHRIVLIILLFDYCPKITSLLQTFIAGMGMVNILFPSFDYSLVALIECALISRSSQCKVVDFL